MLATVTKIVLAVLAVAMVVPIAVSIAAAGGAPPSPPSAPVTSLTGVTWQWVSSVRDDGNRAIPSDPSRYTIEFLADGRVMVQADCNRGSGQYTQGPGAAIAIGPLATTRVACPPGSLDTRFLGDLALVDRFAILPGGQLDLDAPGAAGSAMRFSPSPR
jgi:heat shock protein HslJ